MNDPKSLANEKKSYLTDWLSNAKQINDAVPTVQKYLDLAKWEASTLSCAPNEILSQVSKELTVYFTEDLQVIKRVLGDIPQISISSISLSMAGTTNTASKIYAITDQSRCADELPIKEWGDRHSQEYEGLHTKLARESEVRDLLIKLKPSLGAEFDDAADAYRKAISGSGKQTEAGIAMRNVLEHYKGELMDKAKRYPKEQKVNWPDMAQRLVGDDMALRIRFLQQEEIWNELQQFLSRLAKGFYQYDIGQLKSTFIKLLDHIYIVLSLARLSP